MREAAKYFAGEHNFASFMADKSDILAADAVRTVYETAIKAKILDGGTKIVEIYISASGFLYKMARIMAGTLVEVSEKKIAPEDLPAIIQAQNRSRAGRTLPPHGLYLNSIQY
jgi:tRNA pseudouridine38-40 synthase